MVDLETLGLRPTSVVLSVGLVSFNETSILDKLHVRLAVDQQIEAGRTIDGSTLDWWMIQEEAARRHLFSGAAAQRRLLVEDGLQMIWSFMQGADEVWGNGAAFDNVLLRDLFRHMKGIVPWGYKADRCYRTVKAMNTHVPMQPFRGTEHDALDDAINQTIHLQSILWGQAGDDQRAEESTSS